MTAHPLIPNWAFPQGPNQSGPSPKADMSLVTNKTPNSLDSRLSLRTVFISPFDRILLYLI